jgi:hypothetical protein
MIFMQKPIIDASCQRSQAVPTRLRDVLDFAFPFHRQNRKKGAVEEVGKLLPAIFRAQLRRDSTPLAKILAPLWPRIAGKEIAEHSRPASFVAGTLILGTSCPAWAGQLRRMTEEIRAGVNSFLGCPVVKKVRVQLGTKLVPTEATTVHDHFVVAKTAAAGVNGRTARTPARSRAKFSGGREGRGVRWH